MPDFAAFVQAETICTACRATLSADDRLIVVVRLPAYEADVLCMSCWMVIVTTSSAWLVSGADLSAESIQKRIREALEGAKARAKAVWPFDSISQN